MIVADGQIMARRETEEALIEAARVPLSIVLVGVGDGPWDVMREFVDELPEREFDNFQFVDFHELVDDSGTHPTHVARGVGSSAGGTGGPLVILFLYPTLF